MTTKSFIGVDQIYYALVTQDDVSAYAAAAPVAFAPAMNIAQTPKSNSKVQYADNQPFDKMSSEGETELDVEITGISPQVLATILGRVYDAATGRLFDNGGTPPDIALGFRAKKRGGFYRYYWFLKGSFNSPSEEQATETDTPDPKSTKLMFTAIRTIRQFVLSGSVTDSVKRVVGETSDALFNATNWFSSVQVPVQGSPAAFTCTPSPADGAIGVAVGVVITLTFNHPLAGNTENGIMLLRTSTAAPITVTRTINAARTVVTLTPSANLTAAAAHMIVVPTAVSIYGQALGNTVYDFTTA
ncbi:MAG: Ig-like domain-containing protein [Anaerolineae bacterium]|nr:Ig-like domain-containing protein [Anaerolineae bacterium]